MPDYNLSDLDFDKCVAECEDEHFLQVLLDAIDIGLKNFDKKSLKFKAISAKMRSMSVDEYSKVYMNELHSKQELIKNKMRKLYNNES